MSRHQDDFVHLHTHSHYSLLDGLGKPNEYVERAAALGQPALGLTDHGSLPGAYEHWKQCSDAGIKPIIGVEAYVAPESRTDKNPRFWGSPQQRRQDVSGQGAYTHLTLIAEDAIGLRNLFKLQQRAYAEGFYRKPRIDLDLLAEYQSGLICLTGCPSSATSTLLRLDKADEAREVADKLRSIFGERLWVELMFHGMDWEAEIVQKQIEELAQPLNLPTVATNDAHYALEADASVHSALLCVQTGSTLANPTFSFDGSGYYLKSRSEMESLALPVEGLTNTLAIAERVQSYDDVFAHRLRMPSLGPDDAQSLRTETYLGLDQRVGQSESHRLRADYELDTIISMKYAGYFRVLAKIIRRAKNEGIRIGPGRGSAGGSLVAYALGITDLDPIAHGLLFERFLNPSRMSLPDIDIDVDESKRPRFLELVREEFGEEYVAQIGTHGTIGAKAALKDANRVLGGAYSVGEQRTKMLPPPVAGRQPTLADYQGPKDEIYDLALGLEGTIRNEGIHAAGVIISPEPIADSLPLRRPTGTQSYVTGYTMGELEALGFVKFDFLGLANLGIIDSCLRMLGDRAPVLPTHPDDCNDTKTLRMLADGNTLGVFQLEGHGMQGLLRSVQPTEFSDITAVLALFRPGPMGANAHREYAKRKRQEGGWRASWAIHPELSEPLRGVLEETYGLIVYQEQVLQILEVICGWSYSDAALLFDAMRKKVVEKMEATKPAYMEAGIRRGFSPEALTALWETLVPFADYSFNRAHSAGYGLVAYWTAYLKANYPAEYMASLLSDAANEPDKLSEYLREAKRLGLTIGHPDVNSSGLGFSPDGNTIRYGLGAIKGVGANAYEAIVSRRPYHSLDDFLKRVPKKVLNSGTLGALVKSGSLDGLCPLREELYVARDSLISQATRYRDQKKAGAVPLFPVQFGVGDCGLFDPVARRDWEMEALSVVLTADRRTVGHAGRVDRGELEWLKAVVSQYPGDTTMMLRIGVAMIRVGEVNWEAVRPTIQRHGRWRILD